MKLTRKIQRSNRGRDGKSRSHVIYFLDGVQLLKQKLPYDDSYEYGWQHQTQFSNEYLLNGRIHQTRIKGGVPREVTFPVSKSKIVGIPENLKIELCS